MSLNIFIIVLLQVEFILSSYLEAANNYGNPRVERTNIVNKGTWVRNNKDPDKATSSFLFRGNSIDVDNIVQGDFNAFSDGNVPNSPFISSYVERNKRSSDHKRSRRFRKSVHNCTSKNDVKNDIEDPSLVKSKLLTKLKPASVFNDYPYQIAILLGNEKKALEEAKNYSAYVINEIIKNENISATGIPLNENTNNSNKIDAIIGNNKINYTSVPKRSMKDYESEVIKKIEINEEITTTDAPKQFDRDVFVKNDKGWHQNAPVPDVRRYKVISKTDENKTVKPITERGLIKVLSILTNTFKKIMKQHSDIKDIHKKLHKINDDFMKNVEIISDKFQDFETKYASLITINQKVVEMDEKLSVKEQHFKSKEREMAKNLVDFEIQQKKFLTQQRQFYNIQKLMLAQNERINVKQNAIAKTQSEISHRQNNFARILKKAKQVYSDSKLIKSKIVTAYTKLENVTESSYDDEQTETVQTTTVKPQTTESVKINLFSIPTVSRIENQDHLLLNEKDEQPVDDLVYKYYFNNTFIDSLMKNFLQGFISIGEHNDITRNVKNKRDEVTEGTTILLPINTLNKEEVAGKPVNRERRWISHHSRRKWRHKNKGKAVSDNTNNDDEKPIKNSRRAVDNLLDAQPSKTLPNEGKELNLQKTDPFLSMAKGFCVGIGQNTTQQVLDWCVEKALRRLQNIDIKMPPPPPPEKVEKAPVKFEPTYFQDIVKNEGTQVTSGTSPTIGASNPEGMEPAVTTSPLMYTPMSTVYAETTQNFNMFFPDNEKLENNLKQYDLKADTEGNFYYDGSLHASDVLKGKDDRTDDESDVMPGLESNSRIDNIDPVTFDTQAMRRAFLRRMKYESMLKKISKL